VFYDSMMVRHQVFEIKLHQTGHGNRMDKNHQKPVLSSHLNPYDLRAFHGLTVNTVTRG